MVLVDISEANSVSNADFLYMANDIMEITWDPKSLLPMTLAEEQDVTVTVNIHLAEIDVQTGHAITIINVASNIANTGHYRGVITSEVERISVAVVKLTIANTLIQNRHPVKRSLLSDLNNIFNKIKGQFAVWSAEFFLLFFSSPTLRNKCEEWYKTDPGVTAILPGCPPTKDRIPLCENMFISENLGDTFRNYFHPNTKICYRQNFFPE